MINYHLQVIFILTTISFGLALVLTPVLTKFLYKYKLGKNIRNDGTTPIFSALHAAKQGTPNMAGILIWFTTGFLALVFWFLDRVCHIQYFGILNFMTKRETLVPLGAFLGASAVGLVDDVLDLLRRGFKGRGLRFRYKVFLYAFVAAIGAYWFYFKLGFNTIEIPFYHTITVGPWYILFFILVVVGTSFSVNQTDGLDGLAGGTVLIALFAFDLIAYLQGKYDLAAFISVIIGALLAFLWFNIHPARFFMGDTGSMGLGTVLAIIAFLVHGPIILGIVGIVFVIEALSTFFQLFWRKVFHKKLIRSAPFHNHLQAIGWPESKVVMRLWIVSMIFSILGVVIFFAT